MIDGTRENPRTENDYVGTELWKARSLRKGDFKIVNVPVPIGTGKWQLFNVKNDPGERTDLARQHPQKLNELLTDWKEYLAENNVILPNRTTYDGMEEQLPPRPPVYDPNFGRGSEEVE